jgi:hypothetical protein
MRKLREFDWLKNRQLCYFVCKVVPLLFFTRSIRHFSSITDKLLIEQNPCLLLTRFYRSSEVHWSSAFNYRINKLWRFQQVKSLGPTPPFLFVSKSSIWCYHSKNHVLTWKLLCCWGPNSQNWPRKVQKTDFPLALVNFGGFWAVATSTKAQRAQQLILTVGIQCSTCGFNVCKVSCSSDNRKWLKRSVSDEKSWFQAILSRF